jgi:hypothetical protein
MHVLYKDAVNHSTMMFTVKDKQSDGPNHLSSSVLFIRLQVQMLCLEPFPTSTIPLGLRISLHVTLFSPIEVHRRFGGTCRLHLQGWKVSQARSQWAYFCSRLAFLCMRGFIFSLCSSFKVTDLVLHPHVTTCILYFGNYKPTNNRCNVGSIKQEVTRIASFGFKQ